jgi:hypothetical protein
VPEHNKRLRQAAQQATLLSAADACRKNRAFVACLFAKYAGSSSLPPAAACFQDEEEKQHEQ